MSGAAALFLHIELVSAVKAGPVSQSAPVIMMKMTLFFFMACWAVSALSLAEDRKESKPAASVSPADEFGFSPTPPTPKTSTATTTPTTTTTATTTPTTTTTATTTPTTTTTSTTTTTPKTTTPKTTTTPTTTPKTTTTPTTTTTTTPKTTTTPTTTKPTTPPPPKPTPRTDLRVGNYTLMANKTAMCLMAHMALQIRMGNGKFIVQPNITKVEGGCEATKSNLTLVFQEGIITFIFIRNVTTKNVYVDALSFHLSYPLNKAANSPYVANNGSLHLFAASEGRSYSCKAESIFMGNGLYLDVTHDQMQAYNLTASNDFGKPEFCPADQPDYRVAIAVGVTLLVLIIIVVIAYLLGRRRRTDGYQSL